MTKVDASPDFVERLLPIEKESFLWLNQHRSDFFDSFMYIYSDRVTWFPICAVLFLAILYKQQWREMLLLIFCAFTLGMLCDKLPAELIKPFFERLRPTHHPDFKNIVHTVLNNKGGQFGFISIHASNGFSIAIFTSLLFRYRPYVLVVYLWAFISAYSRIYLGVHFITDVLGGIMWGTFCGLLLFGFYTLFRYKVFHIPKDKLFVPVLSARQAQVIIILFFITLLYITIRAAFFQISQ